MRRGGGRSCDEGHTILQHYFRVTDYERRRERREGLIAASNRPRRRRGKRGHPGHWAGLGGAAAWRSFILTGARPRDCFQVCSSCPSQGARKYGNCSWGRGASERGRERREPAKEIDRGIEGEKFSRERSRKINGITKPLNPKLRGLA